MARKISGASASEMLSGLKSRLGFSQNKNEDEEFARYDADFNDYDDFDDGYDDYADEYEDEFEEYSDTSYSADASGPLGTPGRSSRFGRPDSTPDLVSIEDVREHNRSRVESSRGSYESAHRNGPVRSERHSVETRSTGYASPSYASTRRESGDRSEGLNSLFESTTSFSGRSRDLGPTDRGLTVIKPLSYNDVEGVSRALKAGDAVVLSMRNTPENLFTRILDFSFGVASALDATVDCPAVKVYAIIKGPSLTEEEKSRLRTQGIL